MTTKEIVDRNGRRFDWTECNGHGWFHSIVKTFFPRDIETVMEKIKTLEMRDDDVLICTFPKTGKSLLVGCVMRRICDQVKFKKYLIVNLVFPPRFLSGNFFLIAPFSRPLPTFTFVSVFPTTSETNSALQSHKTIKGLRISFRTVNILNTNYSKGSLKRPE